MVKEQLEASSKKYKQEFEQELEKLVGDVSSLGKDLAYIVGGLALGYQIFNILFKEKEKHGVKSTKIQNKRTSELKTSIVSAITKNATVFLLSMARKRLVSYLDNLNDNNESIQHSGRKK